MLLKERLRREHPNFIFTNVADETKTADVDVTISRLKKIAQVEFTNEEEKVIRELADIRNKMEHFALTISKQQADNIISRLLPFLVSFTRDELGRWLGTEIGEDNWRVLLSSQEHRANVIGDTERKLRDQGKPIYLCPDCDAYTGTFVEKNTEEISETKSHFHYVKCLVCNQIFCGVRDCRRCGREVVFHPGTVPWNTSYCNSCSRNLQEEFPEYYPPILYLIDELRRWFNTHEKITGSQIFDLLSNHRGPGSGFFSAADEILRKGFIDFVYERDRVIHNTRTEVSGGWQQVHKDDTFKWSYRPDLGSK